MLYNRRGFLAFAGLVASAHSARREPNFAALMNLGAAYQHSPGRGISPLPMRLVDIGHLSLPSGQLISASPSEIPDANPLPLHFSPGSYPVTLSIANDRANAAAFVLFSRAKITRWVKLSTSSAAVITFIDPTGQEPWSRLTRQRSGYTHFTNALLRTMEKHRKQEHAEYVETILDPKTGLNLFAVAAASAQTETETWAGYGASRQPVAVLTHFNVVNT
jgi:hypothetical protein